LLPFVKQLIELFAGDEEVASTEAYQLLVGVFEEHCEVKPGKKPPSGYGQPKKRRKGKRKKRRSAATRVRDEIVLKHKKGTTLHSPFDPDVEYGHRGFVVSGLGPSFFGRFLGWSS
jgi:hypothetical protein